MSEHTVHSLQLEYSAQSNSNRGQLPLGLSPLSLKNARIPLLAEILEMVYSKALMSPVRRMKPWKGK